MSRAVLVLVCSMSLVGCIITQEPTFEAPPNTPPMVVSAIPPLNHVVEIVPGVPVTDGGTASTRIFEVTVWDPDVSQDLEGLLFVQHNRDVNNTPLTDRVEIAADGTSTRTVEFELDLNELGAHVDPSDGNPRGCWVLEAHISHSFGNSILDPEPPPGDPLDLGRAIWVLHVTADRDDPVDLSACQ